MAYPTLEEYSQALQHPELAFADPELQRGKVALTALGLPFAMCGGFALTYRVKSGDRQYAVRCFHKESKGLEERYRAISKKIRQLGPRYFVAFDFQAQGYCYDGKRAPIVKMAWAKGETLGSFVDEHHHERLHLQNLRQSLAGLADFLERQGVAHGDIQPGNVMVADQGQSVQLIDYDGMFVEDLRALGSAESGLKNFQHPQRSNQWNARLDRFSFIEIDLSLALLEEHPELWKKTASDGDTFLFRANDIYHPDNSLLFSELLKLSSHLDNIKKFIDICKSSFDAIPSLEEYKTGGQTVTALPMPPAPIGESKYISSFFVLNASQYETCFNHIGDKVELVGQIVEVKFGFTRYRKPYLFLNFAKWHRQARYVRLTIWPKVLEKIGRRNESEWREQWLGKWVSVIGLLEQPYRKDQYITISITIEQPSQIHEIDETEAKYRLGEISLPTQSPSGPPPPPRPQSSPGGRQARSNADILAEMRGNRQQEPTPISASPPRPQPSPFQQSAPNNAILDGIRRRQEEEERRKREERERRAAEVEAARQARIWEEAERRRREAEALRKVREAEALRARQREEAERRAREAEALRKLQEEAALRARQREEAERRAREEAERKRREEAERLAREEQKRKAQQTTFGWIVFFIIIIFVLLFWASA